MAGHSQTKTAEKVGINDRTIRLWLANPEFSAELEARQRELKRCGQMSLLNMVSGALRIFLKALQGEKVSTSQYNIARDILRTHGILAEPKESLEDASATGEITVEYGNVSNIDTPIIDQEKEDA